jgi:hypothetical protein
MEELDAIHLENSQSLQEIQKSFPVGRSNRVNSDSHENNKIALTIFHKVFFAFPALITSE